MTRTFKFAALLLLLLGPCRALACDDDDSDGLDVGLVLSGGGALATTHIGALSVIEALGVPVHCVVGTSMGSVVGALYATGYDADDLKFVFQNSEWPEIFNGTLVRRDKSYLLKEQDDLYLSGYLAGIDRGGLRLPGGFRSMSRLKGLFRSLLRDQPVPSSFDTFKRPYRAVAMDLSTGESVALGSGDVVEAMLASMAVPGVFAPRQIDNRVLVDGGMASQLPVDVAQAMGADLIIALDTTVAPPTAQEDWSVAQVSQQLIRLQVWSNWTRQRGRLGPDDVLIQPDISGLSTASFEKAEQGFASGIEAAQRYQQALLKIRALAAPPKAEAAPRRPSSPSAIPEQLIVTNTSALNDQLIAKRLDFEPRDLEDPVRLQDKLRDLAAFGPFGETDIALSGEGSALLSVTPFPLGRNLLSGGFRAANNFRGDSRYALLGRLSRRPFGGRGGDLRISAELGSDLGLGLELYAPFGRESRFFSVSGLGYRAEQLLLDTEDDRIGEFWQQTGYTTFRLGREIGDWGVLAFDGSLQAVRTEEIVAAVEVPGDSTDQFAGAGMLFAVDTLDRANWPRRGLQMATRAERLEQIAGGGRADTYSLKLLKPLSLGPVDLMLRLDAAATENEGGAVVNIQRLGGFRRLSALAENSLLNDSYVLGSMEVFRRLNPSESIFSVPLYVGALLEAADVRLELFEPSFEDQFYSLATYIGTDTALGPFFLGGGFDLDGNYSLFMHFGRTF